MSDIKTKAIVIKSSDYKENDKLINIFTLESGKLTVQAKSVKNAKSKLKIFTQSFCFADFEITQKGSTYILTGGSVIDSFFALTGDMDKFKAGAAILEVVDAGMREGEVRPEVFVILLKALKTLCYDNAAGTIVLIKFLTDILAVQGYRLNLNKCGKCGSDFFNRIYLNIESGEFVCLSCRSLNDYIEVPLPVYNAVRIISNADYAKLDSIKINGQILDDAVKLLIRNINDKFACKIKAV